MGSGSVCRIAVALALGLALAVPPPALAQTGNGAGAGTTGTAQAIPRLLLQQLSAARGDAGRLLATARLLSAQYPAYQRGIALELLALMAEGQILAGTAADAPALIAQALAAGDRRGLFRNALDRNAFLERLRQTATTRQYAVDRAGTTLAQPMGERDPERQANDETGGTGGGLDFGTIQSMPWYPAALLVSGLALGGTAVALANETDNAEREAAETPAPTEVPSGNTRIIQRTPPPPPAEPAGFEDVAEPLRQGGKAQINALPAQLAGNDGSGVTVAVGDSGIDSDHPDLAVNLLAGTDLLNQDNDANPSGQGDFRSHGTAVAGIIAAAADDFGIQGIAPAARILPVRVGDSVGQVFLDQSAYVDTLIANNVQIANQSFGGGPGALEESDIDPYERGVEAGIIFVWAAGNDGADQPSEESLLPGQEPDLLAGWVTVVAVDENNSLAEFSNKCGDAAAWCVAAPGVGITAPVDGADERFETLYGELSGTSFAAPHVAGALAILKQNFPTTSNADLLQILFQTATELDDDLDAPAPDGDGEMGGDGMDDMDGGMDGEAPPPVSTTFGHGLINLEAALQPVGMLMAVAGESAAAPAVDLRGARLKGGAALGDALSNSAAGITILGVDGYNRAFDVPLGGMARDAVVTGRSRDRLRDFGRPLAMQPALRLGGIRIDFALETRKAEPLAASALDRRKIGGRAGGQIGLAGLAEDRIDRLAAQIDLGAGRAITVRTGDEAASLLTAPASAYLFDPAALANPYLQFGENDLAIGLRLGRWQISGVSNSLPAEQDSIPGTTDPFADPARDRHLALALSRDLFNDRGAFLRLTAGARLEQNRLLGLQGSGALALRETGRTVFAGGRIRLPLVRAAATDTRNGHAMRLSLIAQGYAARSGLPADEGAITLAVERLLTRSWSAGLTGRNTLRAGDRWHALISRPIRAQSGAMILQRPVALTGDDRVILARDRLLLEPGGNALDAELGYGLSTAAGLDFSAVVALSRHPGHRTGQGMAAAGLMRLQHRF